MQVDTSLSVEQVKILKAFFWKIDLNDPRDLTARPVTNPLHRNIPKEQEEIIASLTERYAHRSIRLDSGFVAPCPSRRTAGMSNPRGFMLGV